MILRRQALGVLCLVAVLGTPWRVVHPQTRQNYVVDLGSGALLGVLPFDAPFSLSGHADDRLLSIDLWYARSTVLPPAKCAANTSLVTSGDTVPNIRRLRRSQWARIAHFPTDSFRLFVRPIAANDDYTFCFRMVRRPSAGDSTAFYAAALANVTSTIHDILAKDTIALEDTANVRAVQLALAGALPTADQIVTSGTLFDPTTPPQKLLERLAAFLRFNEHRKSAAKDLNAEHRKPTVDALVEFAKYAPQLDLLLATLDANESNAELSRWRGMRETIASLSGWSHDGAYANYAMAIALGEARLDQRTVTQTAMGYATLWSGDDAAANLARIDSTQALLLNLSDLAHYIATHPELQPKKKFGEVTGASVDTVAAVALRGRSVMRLPRSEFAQLKLVLDQLPQAIGATVASITVFDLPTIALSGTTVADYVARSKFYISADFGFLYATVIGKATPYAGANFYSVPVNKAAPVSECEWDWWICLRKRLSLTAGVTMHSVADAGRTSDLYSNQAGFVGLGLRITDYLRGTAGGLAFHTFSNDAARREQVTMRPAFSLSVDVDVKSTFSDVWDKIFK